MASTELTTSQNAAPPNNASNGTRREASTSPELLSLEILFICTNFLRAELHKASDVRDSHSSSLRICLSGFVHGHSKALGFSGALGAGTVAFSTRAVKFDRAAAGSCHSRSVICIATEIGRRTKPRSCLIQPGWFSAWFSAARISPRALVPAAARSASMAGTGVENFTAVTITANKKHAMRKATPTCQTVRSWFMVDLRWLMSRRKSLHARRNGFPWLRAGAGPFAGTVHGG